jgi:protein gp37
MGDKSAIEWTEASWNPIAGCSRVSEGCRNCYAERQAIRIAAYRNNGVVKSTPAGPRWTGEVRLNPATWTAPLHWRRPRRIFVNSMSDLFHEGISDAHLDELWGLMAKCYWHTFQVLTKRPERMLAYLTGHAAHGRHIWEAERHLELPNWAYWAKELPATWPLPNVWVGVSVEDQATADQRIPLLLQTPAAVRWVSYEPALGLVDFYRWRLHLDWLVVGGESGPGARPFDLAWARSAIAQCRVTGVPVFVKQLGARPLDSPEFWQTWPHVVAWPYVGADGLVKQGPYKPILLDRKGGDPSEWPPDLRVREYPR